MNIGIEKQVEVKIENKTYTIEFPNVGQVMEIESKKIALGGGVYKGLVQAGTKSATYNLDLIDAISTFTVLIPELRKDLAVENFLDIDLFLGKKIVDAYNKQYYPWYKKIQDFLYGEDSTETKKS